MKKIRKKSGAEEAEAIARIAENGGDVSRFFTNAGQMRKKLTLQALRTAQNRTSKTK